MLSNRIIQQLLKGTTVILDATWDKQWKLLRDGVVISTIPSTMALHPVQAEMIFAQQIRDGVIK